METPLSYFSDLSDPRSSRGIRHRFNELFLLTIIGVLCDCNDWVEIETYGKAKTSWLKNFMELPHGIPSHDTLGRVFGALDPEAFGKSFVRWTQSVQEMSAGEIIAIDGKTLCGSGDTKEGKSAIHIISAWASKNQLLLGQIKVSDRSNEITAIPKLLDLLLIKGCIITIDAMGCQQAIAKEIVEKEADYVLALKGNQSALYEQVKRAFEIQAPDQNTDTWDAGHGRIENRSCEVITDLKWLDELDKWPKACCVSRITAWRQNKISLKEQSEVRYYISSLSGENLAHRINQAVRTHWQIENQVHWVLDVIFDEDHSQIRKGFADQNFALVRKIALNILKHDKTIKASMKTKRKRAGWDQDYICSLLNLEN